MRSHHTNIIVINSPHRLDLDDSSFVNEEVRAFNRKLSKIAKKFENISIVNVKSQRYPPAMDYIPKLEGKKSR
jgi:hypothetical protein